MNKEQTQQVNMIDASVAFLNMTVNKVIWTGNATFSAAVGNVLTNMGVLNSMDSVRMSSSTPFTETKGQAKTALIEATMLHAAAGIGCAASAGDTELKSICSIAERSLILCKDADLGNKCRNIYTAVQPYVGSMGDWNVDAATLLSFDGDITTFASLVGTPQAQISTQHAAAKAIDTQIDIIKEILKSTIDTLMVQFKKNEAAFYNGYFSARKIHSTGIHHSTTFAGYIYKTAGVALPHMEVVLTLDGKEIRKHFTDESGHFRFTRLHLGDYVLTVSGAGYVTQTRSFTIDVLQSVEVDFVMAAD